MLQHFLLHVGSVGFRVQIPDSSEMDIVSFSKEEKWIHIVECKRSLKDGYLHPEYANRKKQSVISQLQKRYPKTSPNKWEINYTTVYVYDQLKTSSALNSSPINNRISLGDVIRKIL